MHVHFPSHCPWSCITPHDKEVRKGWKNFVLSSIYYYCGAVLSALRLANNNNSTSAEVRELRRRLLLHPQNLLALESIFDEAWNHKVYLIIGMEIFDSLKFCNYP